MSLENVIQVLELAMKGRISEINEGVLQDKEIRNVLTTFFAEQQARPELTSLIRAPSLMYEYLNLSLDEREELEGFNKSFPYFFKGDKDEIRIDYKLVEKLGNFVKKCRYTEQLLQIFEYYLKNRKSYEIFKQNYLVRNRKINKDLNGKAQRLEKRIRRIFKDNGKFDYIVNLASEIDTRVKQYTERQEVLKIDGARELLEIFEFYISHKKDGQIFNTHYLTKDEEMNKVFLNKGKALYSRAIKNLKRGFSELLILASKERPEILNYTTREKVFKTECIQELARLFDFFMKNRKEGRVFNTNYLVSDATLKKIHGTRGARLYSRAQKFLESGLEGLLKDSIKHIPKIRRYSDKTRLFKLEAVNKIFSFFDYFLKNRKDGDTFNNNYIRENTRVAFGTDGNKLYNTANSILEEKGGFKYIMRIACRINSKIKKYSDTREVFKTESTQHLLNIFDFYLENKDNGEKFNPHYISRNEIVRRKFGYLGNRIYDRAQNKFRKEGGINYIVQLAAEQRPEILQYWSYDGRRGRRK